jgi:hypothetical protein
MNSAYEIGASSFTSEVYKFCSFQLAFKVLGSFPIRNVVIRWMTRFPQPPMLGVGRYGIRSHCGAISPQISPIPEKSDDLEVLLGMSDQALNDLYEQHVPFRLYIDHRCGETVEELARLTNRSAHWVQERIEAMRLCLEMQVRIEDETLLSEIGQLSPFGMVHAQYPSLSAR